MISGYKPKKPFFKMNIKELQVYVNHCKNIDKNKKINKNNFIYNWLSFFFPSSKFFSSFFGFS